jgi:hypothetical protein
MTKFDEEKVKLRRCFSLEEIKEEDQSWYISEDDNKSESSYDSEEEGSKRL